MYHSEILDVFGDSEDGRINEARWYSRRSFEKWWHDYVKAELMNRRGEAFGRTPSGRNDTDDWTQAGSSYAV
jgi:hypothetical protein